MAPKIPTSSEQGKVIVIDAHHPLYLQACDTPGSSLVSIQLTGSKTYFLWSRSMKIGLLVLSWIMMISVSRELLSGIVYASSALQVWNDLKERFDKCRSQIMMMDHTPSVNKAYSLVMAEECQRILGKANIAGSEASSNSMIPNSGQLSDAMAFFSSNKGYPTSSGSGSTSVSNYRSQKPQNNSNLYCDYCNRKGHTRAICFRLHGYLAN
ncbi:hypothetical protein KY290_023021 [Solanum tuberosum]|uniref:Retrotransposon Copia-like N-terminal domain-containing protein n=1 Tax=Solanum tuberosum TaxID=4113 RepID=A0ABQ7V627_SOLTU|nr:hypothetical protein KY284_021909 [Solanum tuberosum]KAH0759528.1 hypothetical protein KY290_023021 [Solanum tuberosum]